MAAIISSLWSDQSVQKLLKYLVCTLNNAEYLQENCDCYKSRMPASNEHSLRVQSMNYYLVILLKAENEQYILQNT